MNPWGIRHGVQILWSGGIIAYPTEAVFGLGCDPGNEATVLRLLAVKRRPVSQGLILVAAHFAQLKPLLGPLPKSLEARVQATWPGPVTWLWPAREWVPTWLRGGHDTLAVRVTAHPVAAALCDAFGGPLVSTSANISGGHPARTPLAVRRIFRESIDGVIHGELGSLSGPTPIRDARNGRTLRDR